MLFELSHGAIREGSKIRKMHRGDCTGQKYLLCHITQRLEKLSQQDSSKNTYEMGENSIQNSKKFGRRSPHSSPIKIMGLLSSIIPMTIKLDFPRYSGNDDPTIWVC